MPTAPLLSLWDVNTGLQLKDGVVPFGWVQRGSFSDPIELEVWNNRVTSGMVADPAATRLFVSWPDAINVTITAYDDGGNISDRFEKAPHWLHVEIYDAVAKTWSPMAPVTSGTLLFPLLKGTAYSPSAPKKQPDNWGKIRLTAFVPSTANENENFNFKVRLGSTSGPVDPPSPEAIAAGISNY